MVTTTATATEKRKLSQITLRTVARQIIASIMAHCIVIQAGINMAYSTVLTKDLNDSKVISVNDTEISWIVSLVTMLLPMGSLIAGPLMDKFGRKMVCLLSCIFSALSWILLINAESLTTIYIARIAAGIAAGLTTVSLVYVSEITHPQIRPMLLCLNSVFVSLGILITCCLAIKLDWRGMAMAFFVLISSTFLLLLFIPESPYWLICFENERTIDEERLRRAKRSLKWLNKDKAIYEEAYLRLEEAYQGRIVNKKISKNIITILRKYWQILVLPSTYKPLTILFFLLLLQQLSGSYIMIFYAMHIFGMIGGTFGKGIDENGALVIVGIIRFLMSIIIVCLSKRYGRRLLCILSGLGMAFSMFVLGMYMYMALLSTSSTSSLPLNDLSISLRTSWVSATPSSLLLFSPPASISSSSSSSSPSSFALPPSNLSSLSSSLVSLSVSSSTTTTWPSWTSPGVNETVERNVQNSNWIQLVFVLLYICMSSLGFTVIPWTLIGELLPVSIRGVGGGLMVSVTYLIMSGVLKSYLYALKFLSVHAIFFFFSFASLLGAGFVYFFLPETLGKSFADIEKHFL